MGGNRQGKDYYARRASRENYPARSVYKLEEIDRRVQLFKKGHKVLDLGAAPGSWTLYAAKQVGKKGKVVAIDRASLSVGVPENVITIEADALALDTKELKETTGLAGFNAVISDMAPRTSGHKFVDQSRSFTLFSRALELALELVLPKGAFVGKIFQGEDFEIARNKLRENFTKVRIIKPASVRSESYEIYLVGLGRR